ncbi:hypothetical protein GUJ93_ZPchr0002g23962 [Zizania palustris]|uniref:Uncharacterized protein n=1 Tax=Zizania palustris TaxID=103762 RepID=A0A8J5SS69_ZIZPA|nr:hypothetical protein GUJ93_ZPchr0002g23962 [Zizania palustris]
MCINSLVDTLHKLGKKMEDSRVVWKILRVLLRKMRRVAVSIQMLLDLNTMTMEELIGRLRVAEEEDDVEEDSAGPTCLLLTKE